MKEIGYDLPKFFPLREPENVAYGHITNKGTNMCVDGKHGGQGLYIKIMYDHIRPHQKALHYTAISSTSTGAQTRMECVHLIKRVTWNVNTDNLQIS